jgi:hypothetical protein
MMAETGWNEEALLGCTPQPCVGGDDQDNPMVAGSPMIPGCRKKTPIRWELRASIADRQESRITFR